MVTLAVFTGDIVGSRKLEPGGLEKAFEGLARAATRLEASTHQKACLTRVRGDGWQAISTARFALRGAFLLRAGVRQCGKAFHTRVGLGIGFGDVRGNTLEDADGAAFVASGHALDTMRKSRRIAGEALDLGLATALPLADRISGGWTPRQAEIAVLALSLPQPSQDHVARTLGVSRQAIQQHWDAAHLDAVADSCVVYEETASCPQAK